MALLEIIVEVEASTGFVELADVHAVAVELIEKAAAERESPDALVTVIAASWMKP